MPKFTDPPPTAQPPSRRAARGRTSAEHALHGVPVEQYPVPEGVVNAGGEWYYSEFANGAGVASLGLDAEPVSSTNPVPLAPAEERNRILDLFRNNR